MTGTTSFTEITLSQNRVPSSRTVSYFVAKPSSSEMEKLQLGPEDSIYEWKEFVLRMTFRFV